MTDPVCKIIRFAEIKEVEEGGVDFDSIEDAAKFIVENKLEIFGPDQTCEQVEQELRRSSWRDDIFTCIVITDKTEWIN